MLVTLNTTIRELLRARPESIEILERHGIEVSLACSAESMLDQELESCGNLCPADDMDQLLSELQNLFFTSLPTPSLTSI